MADVSGVVMVYVPCGSHEEASRIARTLLAERLIACADIYESQSLYVWQGELASEQESVMICKTTPERAAAVEVRVLDLHSYELPCVLRIEPAHANPAYAHWVAGEVAELTPSQAVSTE